MKIQTTCTSWLPWCTGSNT